MSLESAWRFLRLLENEFANGALIAENPGECTLADLLARARQLGLVFGEDDLREAFRRDWAMRAHYYGAGPWAVMVESRNPSIEDGPAEVSPASAN